MTIDRDRELAGGCRRFARFAVLVFLISIVASCGAGSTTSGAAGNGGATASDGSTTSGSAGGSGGATANGGATGSGGAAASGGSMGGGGAGSGGSADGGSSQGGAFGTSGTGGAAVGGSTGRSAGCGKTSTLRFGAVPNENPNAAAGSGQTVGHGDGGWLTIQSGGQSRGFATRLPDNYDVSHPYWLIFAFHWNGGTSDQVDNGGSNGYWWSYYGLQRESNNGAIFVAPQGLGNAWPNPGGRDLTFTDDMLKLIGDNYCVDTTHIITAGFSYGAGMSYAIACARATVFHAAVLYEAGVLSGCDGGNDPIAYMQIEGITDTTLPIGGSIPMRDRFVKNNRCTAQTPPQPPNPPPYLSSGGHICTNYSGCSNGHPLRWCVHQSGHGPGPVDGTPDLFNSCATAPRSCSSTCPCTWTPTDVWTWLASF